MKQIEYPQLMQNTNYDCGVIAVQEALLFWGFEIRYNKLFKMLKTTKTKGTSVKNVLSVLDLYGVKYSEGEMSISELKSSVKSGIPVIVLLQAPTNNCLLDTDDIWDRGHYATVIGIKKGRFIIEDPYVYCRQELKFSLFKERWHDKDKNKTYNQYGISILRNT